MIQINGRHYAKGTIMMVDSILASNNKKRGFWRFCVKINLGDGEVMEEWIYSLKQDKVFIEKVKSHILEQINF